MTATLLSGPRQWTLTVDDEGHSEYKITHRVVTDDPRDGPATVRHTPGLPLPGSYWDFDNDSDLWAWCRPNMSIVPVVQNEPNTQWDVEQIFSTRPLKRCQDEAIEDPLLQPPEVSGTFVKYVEEATHDRFGDPLQNSAHEQLRGPQVEFDANRPAIKIKFNVSQLNLVLLVVSVDTVNDAPLWGLPARCVKLSAASWERKFYGLCSIYYTISLEFDIRYDTFDRNLLDEGTKVLRGEWHQTTGHWVLKRIGGELPDFSNPSHFIRFKDRNAENTRVILDGLGRPAGVCIDGDYFGTGTSGEEGTGTGTGACIPTTEGTLHIEKYGESNLLALGIPLTF